MAAKGEKKGRKLASAPVTDSRFEKVNYDPRFRQSKKTSGRTIVKDDRFKKMFDDDSFKMSAGIDKYGRKVEAKDDADIRHFYQMEKSDKEDEAEEEEEDSSDDEGRAEIKQQVESESEEESDSDAPPESSSTKAPREDASDSDSDSDSDGPVEESSSKPKPTEESDEESEKEMDDDEKFANNAWMDMGESSDEDVGSSGDEIEGIDDIEGEESEHEDIDMGESSKRFAIQNMDWQYIKSNDLMVLLSSFLPPDGTIVKISVHPSHFGLEQMKMEATHGPSNLFKKEVAEEIAPDTVYLGAPRRDHSITDDGFEAEKLREYEINKMKYYFAVAEFDSKETAEVVFDECDGREFEHSSNFLDCRFIPDDFEIDTEERDSCTEMPKSYAPKEFFTKALQTSNVELTWDTTDRDRQRMTTKKFTADDLEKLDFNDYIANESDDEEGSDAEMEKIEAKLRAKNGEDDEKKEETKAEKKKKRKEERAKYKALLATGEKKRKFRTWEKESDDEELQPPTEDSVFEVSFDNDIANVAKKLVDQKVEEKLLAEETLWETRMRKSKEKKKAYKASKKENAEGDDLVDGGMMAEGEDLGFDDPFFKMGEEGMNESEVTKSKSKKKKVKKEKTVDEEKTEAELALMMAEDDGHKHFNRLALAKREREEEKVALGLKKAKKKKNVKKIEGEDFKMDVNDSRFGALYNDTRFKLDQYSTDYRLATGMKDISEEVKRRRESEKPEKKKKTKTITVTRKVKKKELKKKQSAELLNLADKFK